MANFGQISTKTSAALRGTIQALKTVDKDIAANIRKYTKAEMSPVWQQELAQHSLTRTENAVLVRTATVTVTNQNVILSSAMKGTLNGKRGGTKSGEIARPVEFGASRDTVRSYTSHRKGKAFRVKNRHTTHQLRPSDRKGYVVYPSFASIVPRFASMWVQTTVRTIYEAFEKGSDS